MTILLNKPVAPRLKVLNKYLEIINKTGWYSNFGPLHAKLTNRLEEFLGIDNLLLVSNGTLALHVMYRTLGIKNAICTPFSYSATASSLYWEKIPFSFVDIDSKSLNLCPELALKKIQSNKNIDAVVATHVYGNPCDVDAFDNLKKKHNLKIIYDGAHAFNIKLADKSILNFGDASSLSFHATKLFHTIEGGAVIFKSKEHFNQAKSMINFGLEPDKEQNKLGINAKLNEYQCAVGLTLLDEIDLILEKRIKLFNLYKQNLQGYIDLPFWNIKANENGAYFPVIFQSEVEKKSAMRAFADSNIPCREYFSPSLNVIYKNEDSCPISESTSSRILCLPMHFYLTNKEINSICKVLLESIA